VEDDEPAEAMADEAAADEAVVEDDDPDLAAWHSCVDALELAEVEGAAIEVDGALEVEAAAADATLEASAEDDEPELDPGPPA